LKGNSANALKEEIAEIESSLAELDKERASLDERLQSLQTTLREALSNNQQEKTVSVVLSPEEKIHIFRDLFRGQEDVYPKLWTSKKTGAKGYSPVCLKEWQSGICRKPTVKCSECNHRAFAPVTDSVIRQHLDGQITAGVYPLLEDDTCWFLAVDFDKKEWACEKTRKRSGFTTMLIARCLSLRKCINGD
jgi:hypothetical protein